MMVETFSLCRAVWWLDAPEKPLKNFTPLDGSSVPKETRVQNKQPQQWAFKSKQAIVADQWSEDP